MKVYFVIYNKRQFLFIAYSIFCVSAYMSDDGSVVCMDAAPMDVRSNAFALSWSIR